MALIYALPALVLTFGLFLWSLASPTLPAWIFIAVLIIIDAVLLLLDFGAKGTPTRITVLPHEEETFRRHWIYLLLPGGASVICLWLQVTRWSAVFWVPWLGYNGAWWLAAAIALHFFVTSSLSVRLNPIGPYALEAQRGNADFAREVQILQSLLKRLHDPPSPEAE